MLKNIYKAFQATSGSVEQIADLLRDNNLVLILPGGHYEAFFSDDKYSIKWGKRKGFAKVASTAKVVINFKTISLIKAKNYLFLKACYTVVYSKLSCDDDNF